MLFRSTRGWRELWKQSKIKRGKRKPITKEQNSAICQNSGVRQINGRTVNSLIDVFSTFVNGLLFVEGSGTGPKPTISADPEAGEFHTNAKAYSNTKVLYQK